MSTSSNRGGGFFIGAAYGAIASLVLFLVLAFLFPLTPETGAGPSVAANATAPVATAPVVTAPVAMDNTEIASAVMASTGNTAAPVDVPATTAAMPAQAPAAPTVTDSDTGAMVSDVAMGQPNTGEASGIALGEATDTTPATASSAPAMVNNTAVIAPRVETQSAAVPDVGNGTLSAAAPDTGSNAQTTTVAVEEAPAATAATALSQAASGPATKVFAVPFAGDPSKPMLAIVLEDTLETSLAPLFDTGTPLTFAIPAGVDARASSKSIRESGYEVVAMVPEGTSRTENVAENVARFMANVPVAVALLDSNSSALMLNRNRMQTVLRTVEPAGLGVIVFAGTGDFLARDQALRAGNPFGIVVQTLDVTDDTDLIVQALDRAAFEALTKGSAIVFARTKPATIEAIVRWLGGAYARRLQIVPVSAAIQAPNN